MSLREHHLQQLNDGNFDVLIIGGGINGAVSAAALTAEGIKVALIEQGDFAGFTSQESSNLAWGGIKYLETYEFGLVRQLCKSRNRLMQHYASTVREIRFLTTIHQGFRHRPFLLWLGAWLYWAMGNGLTKPPRLLTARQIKQEESVINTAASIGGLEYSDAYLYDNDARFVFNFVRAALDDGCRAVNYVESLGSRWDHGVWVTTARDVMRGSVCAIRSKVLINAAGAFVDVLNRRNGQTTAHRHVFSKGIHLIVDRITSNRRVLAFFANDGRLFFAIPMGTKTCIGTTDTRVDDPITTATDEDRRFVLDNINTCLSLGRPLTVQDIIAERCGVRPLAIEGLSDDTRDFFRLSREHAIDVDPHRAHLSIFGGKLTDCLNVGDEICGYVHAMGIDFPQAQPHWYGERGASVQQDFLRRAEAIHLDRYTPPSASESLTSRLWRHYGAAAVELLDAIREDSRQADVLLAGSHYMRCEIEQAARRDMIVKLEDFLRRRTRIALERRQEDLKNDAGLPEVCNILFGGEAQSKYEEYFADVPTLQR